MSKLQTWAIGGIGAVALGIGALLASGAVTSAQTSTPPATEAPSPSGGQGDHNGDNANCPNMGPSSSGGTRYGGMTPNGGVGFHGHHHSSSTVSNSST